MACDQIQIGILLFFFVLACGMIAFALVYLPTFLKKYDNSRNASYSEYLMNKAKAGEWFVDVGKPRIFTYIPTGDKYRLVCRVSELGTEQWYAVLEAADKKKFMIKIELFSKNYKRM